MKKNYNKTLSYINHYDDAMEEEENQIKLNYLRLSS